LPVPRSALSAGIPVPARLWDEVRLATDKLGVPVPTV
jgi:hypothetical protein